MGDLVGRVFFFLSLSVAIVRAARWMLQTAWLHGAKPGCQIHGLSVSNELLRGGAALGVLMLLINGKYMKFK